MPRRLRRLPTIALPGATCVLVAAGMRARLLGLALLRSHPPTGAALLLAPCRSVHTAGMRWALDLVWLGPGGSVVRVDEAVPPWRVRSCRAARAVLEVPAGGGSALAARLAAPTPARSPPLP